MNVPLATGYVKDCALHGCTKPCNDFDAHCEYIPVMIVPIDEAELERLHVKGQLEFGDEHSTDPWTKRRLDNPLRALTSMSIKINTHING